MDNSSLGRHVVIVGGGITGLALAYRLLERNAGPAGARVRVTVLEQRKRLGGNIWTERHDGFILDAGPDAFVAMKPEGTQLCRDLGIGDRLVETVPKNRKVYVLNQKVLHPIPAGMVLAVPSEMRPLLQSQLLSWKGKSRVLLDLLLPRQLRDDESIASFVRRRLGSEVLERIADPLLGGIYAGSVEDLSIRSTFPQLMDYEAKHRSLIRAVWKERKKRGVVKGAPPKSAFYSLASGMSELPAALEAEIQKRGGVIQRESRVKEVRPKESISPRYDVIAEQPNGGETLLSADELVLAIPAHEAAPLFGSIDSEVVRELKDMRFASTATVLLAYSRADVAHALDAVGLIIPKTEQEDVLAATFVSSKWGGRSPDKYALFRVFFGGYGREGILTNSDAHLSTLADAFLQRTLGTKGRPTFSRVFRFTQASVQPVVGHAARVERIRRRVAEHPGLHVGGASFGAVGIPECAKQALEIGLKIAGQA